MANDETVRTRDVLPVYSRISWGAILAGLFVTLAVFVLLSTLGLAIGISAADETNRDNVTVGAGIWAVITALIAFFCGGCVVSRFTAGETKAEAVMYGTVLWGASFARFCGRRARSSAPERRWPSGRQTSPPTPRPRPTSTRPCNGQISPPSR